MREYRKAQPTYKINGFFACILLLFAGCTQNETETKPKKVEATERNAAGGSTETAPAKRIASH